MFDQIINTYLFVLGIALISIGIIELFIPIRIFNLWKKWVLNKLFFLHGLFLICAGFPLTLYNNLQNSFITKAIFTIGLIVVFTGPFILFYPGKIREMFLKMSEETEDKGIKRIIYFDAIIRILAGLLFVYSYFS